MFKILVKFTEQSDFEKQDNNCALTYSRGNNTVTDGNKIVAVQGVCNLASQMRHTNQKISVSEADIFSSEVNGHSASQETVKQRTYLRNDE
jgi:hypothetical protein